MGDPTIHYDAQPGIIKEMQWEIVHLKQQQMKQQRLIFQMRFNNEDLMNCVDEQAKVIEGQQMKLKAQANNASNDASKVTFAELNALLRQECELRRIIMSKDQEIAALKKEMERKKTMDDDLEGEITAILNEEKIQETRVKVAEFKRVLNGLNAKHEHVELDYYGNPAGIQCTSDEGNTLQNVMRVMEMRTLEDDNAVSVTHLVD